MSRQVLRLGGAALLAVAIALGVTYALTRAPPGRLAFDIEAKPAIMSGAYKVYGNPAAGNGRYWMSKVVIKNEGGAPVENVTVSYQIPGLITWTTPREYPRILPGQSVVSLFYPRLPDSVALKTTTTTEQVEMRVEYADHRGEKHETRQMEFQLHGHNDLIYTTLPESELLTAPDYYENTQLAAAFVTPDDPVIKYFVEQLEKRVMGGTLVGAGASPKEIGRFMATVFAYEQASGIIYAGTEGLPGQKIGSAVTMIQKVRLPREVLLGGAGLCIELASLYATISEAAGLDPVIFLTSTHAFPGVRVNGELHGFESTQVGIPGMGEKRHTFDEALKRGEDEKVMWMNGGSREIGQSIMLLDLHYLHHAAGIIPPELPDDPAARQKIDETFDRLLGSNRRADADEAPAQRPPARRAAAAPAPSRAPSANPNPGVAVNRYADPNRFFTLTLPASWSVTPYPVQRFKSLALSALDAEQNLGLAVYVFPGSQTVETAFSQINAYATSAGAHLSFKEQAPVKNGGRDYRQFFGRTSFDQGGAAREWVAYARSFTGGAVVITLGAKQGQLVPAMPLLHQVFNTFDPGA
ncbi:MAG TPA: hypothetical protein VK676_10140 [Steroidobacteraceae bacterium]|jgi:hypothetical protein|nr:hypothetical protein [Steroidobacteraceae bacterium]